MLHLVEATGHARKHSLNPGDMDAVMAAEAVRLLITDPLNLSHKEASEHKAVLGSTALVGTKADAQRLATVGFHTSRLIDNLRSVGETRVWNWSEPSDAPCWLGEVPEPLDRAALGLSEEPLVVALCTDPPSAADARRFVFFIALMEALGRPVVGLIPRDAWNVQRAARFARSAGPQWKLRLLDAPLPACWNAINLGVVMTAPWTLDHDTTLLHQRQTRLCASAHAHGVPVLWAGEHPPSDVYPTELLSELTCPTDEARRLAQHAIYWLEDAHRINQCSEQVRSHVKERLGGKFESWVAQKFKSAERKQETMNG